ncbi:unnamed protein product [Spirodela intermedia]|uniref:C2 domain-containing protein n=1 Tax=Spirodela intermedia TaxID=51605 RepID=A0A7I8JQD7_SPIIN|nr:unnamed protein product [Spirodela intermedia]CAA6671793.1 unnamed protein product [Spirodela intermedia]
MHEGYNNESFAATQRLKDLMQKSNNRLCVDCGAPDPNGCEFYGPLCCLQSDLGTHISKEEVDSMVTVGRNSYTNAIYKAFIPIGFKPELGACYKERAQFFLKPSLCIVSSSSRNSFQYFDSEKDLNDTGMVEYVEVLKVKVIKGTDLAIRDIRTRDPYVVLALGHQMRIIYNFFTSFPTNEELQLSIPQGYGTLKLRVFDYDTFLVDDILSEVEVDLQPMITSAMAFGDSEDNTLVDDNTINIIDCKEKIELEMEWIPLDQ